MKHRHQLAKTRSGGVAVIYNDSAIENITFIEVNTPDCIWFNVKLNNGRTILCCTLILEFRGKFLRIARDIAREISRIARDIARQLRGIGGELRGLRGKFRENSPKYCIILKKSELISRFCIVKTLKICLFQQKVYEDHEIQNLLLKFTFRNISLEKNPKTF